jgi:hypothetical protein
MPRCGKPLCAKRPTITHSIDANFRILAYPKAGVSHAGLPRNDHMMICPARIGIVREHTGLVRLLGSGAQGACT